MSSYCTYITVYTGNKMPPFYIGHTSIKKIKSGYHGSVSSKEYKALWLNEQLNNPQLFKTFILTTHTTREEAVSKEIYFQTKLNVHKNLMYINRAICGKRFFPKIKGYKNSDTHNRRISNTLKGKRKSQTQIKKMVETRRRRGGYIPWNKGLSVKTDSRVANNYEKMIKHRQQDVDIGNKISKALKEKKLIPWNKGKSNVKIQGANNKLSKRVIIGGNVFCSIREAVKITKLSTHVIRNICNNIIPHKNKDREIYYYFLNNTSYPPSSQV